MAAEPLRILGVDTSLRSTGVGVIEVRGSSLAAVYQGLIRNPPDRPHSKCLENLQAGIEDVIRRAGPREAAVEGIFYCKNVRTAVVLGEARGVVLAACARAGLPVFEYPPKRVKQSLVGVGSAQKDQVARMVMSLLNLKERPAEDAADALAIAICHLHSRSGHPALAPREV
ncbi:MAG: crossover junction endodeoxyribonuclease RuvC [Kiritimatiellae bacterium]|nr:crossover junction endodeoxyribonuclease RuvC [Kiritimatiellia bacterium]